MERLPFNRDLLSLLLRELEELVLEGRDVRLGVLQPLPGAGMAPEARLLRVLRETLGGERLESELDEGPVEVREPGVGGRENAG